MAGEIEDFNGSMPFICFPANYEKFKTLFVEDNIVRAGGFLTLDARGDEDYKVQLQINKLEIWDNKNNVQKEVKANVKKLYINFIGDDILFSKIMNLLSEFKGDMPVYIQHNGKLLDSGVKCEDCWSLVISLKELVGEKNVIIK